ncbi:hypothetical protein DAPPUDRAFT_277504 [Daphnia pulex]|uniref:Uncharacterized protein n=1 Tax=Daphnia pulex TaxID=6669 RepID=E9I6E3_DAPPU|nr:hypothetical protein DAPPUDRAFT_277504 [Daphnia pulex]|eukprot:EFX60437.1 hypothetical protein DAPPUDRAFT_277504 [Daphnia pulex]
MRKSSQILQGYKSLLIALLFTAPSAHAQSVQVAGAAGDQASYGKVESGFPIMTADPLFICSGIQYLDSEGILRLGTRNCTGSRKACQIDKETDCVTTASVAAGAAKSLAAKIIIGQSLGGVVGQATAANYQPCTGPQQSGCIATEVYKTMNLSGASPSITDLTASGFGAALQSNASFEVWDSSGVRHQLTGDAQFATNNILSGTNIFGVAGSLLALPATCSSDGQTSCVVLGPTYAAALKAGAENKLIAAQTLAGVAGTVSVPAVSKVLGGTQYGTAGTALSGTLTLPAAADVRLGSPAYGEAASLITPSYSPNFPDPANVRTSDTVNGVPGALGNCSAGNQSGCVTTPSFKSMDLSAATGTDLTAANFNTRIKTAASFEF